jgi:hypothetical protein
MPRPLRCLLIPLVCSVATLEAGEVAAQTVAKVIRIIATSSGGDGKVACHDLELSSELLKLGVRQDFGARIVWATSESDVVKYSKQNKMVICGQVSFLSQGASVAIVTEGGRPSIYVSPASVAASNMVLPDALLKIAKVVK